MWKLTFKCTPNKTLNEIDFQACGHIPHAWLPYMKHLSAESIYMGHSFLIKQVEHIKICRKENTPQKTLKGVVRISHSSCHWCQILLVVYSFTHWSIPKEGGLTLQIRKRKSQKSRIYSSTVKDTHFWWAWVGWRSQTRWFPVTQWNKSFFLVL